MRRTNMIAGRRRVWRSVMTRGIVLCCLLSYGSTGCLYSHRRPAGMEPQARIIEGRAYSVLGESEAKNSSFNLLWIIPVTPRVDYDRAVNEAVAARGGDNLIEVRTWVERQIWIVGMVEILHVKGTVIKYEK